MLECCFLQLIQLCTEIIRVSVNLLTLVTDTEKVVKKRKIQEYLEIYSLITYIFYHLWTVTIWYKGNNLAVQVNKTIFFAYISHNLGFLFLKKEY